MLSTGGKEETKRGERHSGAGGHSRGALGRSLRLRTPGEQAGESPAPQARPRWFLWARRRLVRALQIARRRSLPRRDGCAGGEDSGDLSSQPVIPPALPAGTPDAAPFPALGEKGVPCPPLFLRIRPRTPFWRPKQELCPQGSHCRPRCSLRCSPGTTPSAVRAGNPGTSGRSLRVWAADDSGRRPRVPALPRRWGPSQRAGRPAAEEGGCCYKEPGRRPAPQSTPRPHHAQRSGARPHRAGLGPDRRTRSAVRGGAATQVGRG